MSSSIDRQCSFSAHFCFLVKTKKSASFRWEKRDISFLSNGHCHRFPIVNGMRRTFQTGLRCLIEINFPIASTYSCCCYALVGKTSGHAMPHRLFNYRFGICPVELSLRTCSVLSHLLSSIGHSVGNRVRNCFRSGSHVAQQANH